MRSGRRRVTSALVATLTAATMIAPFTSARASHGCHVAGRVVERGPWITVTVPKFETGERAMTAYAIDYLEAQNMFVTNGLSVMRTTDGGCKWQTVFTLGETPGVSPTATAANSLIKSVVVPRSPALRDYVFLMIEESTGAPRPHVFRSTDRGDTWEAAELGLPPTGSPEFLEVGIGDPQPMYVGIDVGGGAIDLLYASGDRGDSWEPRSGIAEVPVNAGVAGLTIDPIVSDELWAWGAGGLYHSTNGGESFRAVDEFAQTAAGPVSIWHFPQHPPSILVFAPRAGGFLRSDDGGKTWLRRSAPGAVQSIAHGPGPDVIVISASGRIYVYFAPAFAWIPLDAPNTGIVDVVADRFQGNFYGRTPTTIEIYTGERGAAEVPDQFIDVPLLQSPDIPEPRPPRLSPERRKVVLDPGDSKKITYRLLLPRRPVPLDIYFLVDTSSSMGHLLAGLVKTLAAIVNGLAQEGIDAKFGLAEYRSYPDRFPPSAEEENFVYRRQLDIGASTAALRDAMSQLEVGGGGRYDAHLGALWQTATGAGQDVDPKGPTGEDVPPGQQANFRAKALRVVLHGTDEPFGTESGDRDDADNVTGIPGFSEPDIPDYKPVIDSFNAKGIHQIGLAVGLDPQVAANLRRLAAGTGALAPPEGVDCNGDGATDVPEGHPLVCQLPAERLEQGRNLVPAIVNLVEAVRVRTSVALDAAPAGRRGGADSPVVGSVVPASYPAVVLQSSNDVTFDVNFRCPVSLAGKRFEVRLRTDIPDYGESYGGAPPSSLATVVCRDLEEAPPPLVPPAFGLVGLAVVPPAPPPPPITQVGSQTQSQTQAQAQAGFATQEEEQPQTALVTAFRAEEEEELVNLAMSSYERRTQPLLPAGAAVTLGAGFIALAFGWGALAHQPRTRVRRVYTR